MISISIQAEKITLAMFAGTCLGVIAGQSRDLNVSCMRLSSEGSQSPCCKEANE